MFTGKISSRKFIVWMAFTVFMALGFAFPERLDLSVFIPWYGSISALYIGGNVAQDFAKRGIGKDE